MLINVNNLKLKFNENYSRLSYSKLKQFTGCELSYFIDAFLESDTKSLNHRWAVSGIIIQRIFEELFNEKVYLKYQDSDDLNLWIKDNVIGLYYLIKFNITDQYNSEINNFDYFKSIQGLDRIEIIKSKYPLFSITTGINPIYIDDWELIKDFISINTFLNSLVDIAIQNVFNISNRLNTNPKNIKSEVYLKYQYNDILLSGKLDFITNNYSTESFSLFDGKFYSSNLDKTQLIFYCYLIKKLYNTDVKTAGFLFWKDKKFKEIKITKKDFNNLEQSINEFSIRINKIKEIINAINTEEITLDYLFDILNHVESFSNCRYCSIKDKCKFAIKK